MTSRHRRVKQLSAHGQERFLADATDMHRRLTVYMVTLQTNSPHYRAVWMLHDALIEAIEEVTGKPAPWIRQSSSRPSSPKK